MGVIECVDRKPILIGSLDVQETLVSPLRFKMKSVRVPISVTIPTSLAYYQTSALPKIYRDEFYRRGQRMNYVQRKSPVEVVDGSLPSPEETVLVRKDLLTSSSLNDLVGRLRQVKSVRKIVNLDQEDAHVLNKARIECQSHRLTVEDPVTISALLEVCYSDQLGSSVHLFAGFSLFHCP
ncbi:hypothetical protein MKW98_008227 [Papaver atlanticum]|uniref:Uncharacterized protein n=1 Tax=Papaver atlanticum TaxID=357466 RepID=A0AAD4RWL4_9MAGN|nr:hypothetical protein MKW98_008227 [Papaver atlanticum]